VSRGLAGRRVVVTRPEAQSDGLSGRLRALGAEPVELPVIAIAPPEAGGRLDQAIARLESYDWVIFTSVNGVEHFWARLDELVGRNDLSRHPSRMANEFPAHLKIAAIGPATAEALRRRGARADLVPAEYRAEAILGEIGDVAGKRILLPRADIARRALADGLRAMRAEVDEVDAYRTITATPSPQAVDLLKAGVDVVTFTSSSTVRNFVRLTAGLSYGNPVVACIGPVTAATARELGLRVDVTAREYTMDGLIDALERWFQ